jgi:hypothetical protein
MNAEQEPLVSEKTLQVVRMMHENTEPLEALVAAHPELGDDLDAAAEQLQFAADVLWGIKDLADRRAKRQSRPKASGDAYQLKITLSGSKPPIWRRVVVPVEITLDLLHDVIQIVMGWEDAHLHMFDIHDEIYENTSIEGAEGEDETDYRLCDVITAAKDQFTYTYDYGDNWEHRVTVEKLIPAAKNPPMMTCTAGKNHAPFEDNGGLWGYYDMLEALADPKHPEHERLKEWIGGEPFDPEAFDIEAVNKQLKELI